MKKDKIVPPEPARSERALAVKCDIIKINEKKYSFVVEATRLREDSLEQFPNTEHIRLLIFDNKGKIIWRSDDKYAFSGAQSKPLPDTVGQTYKYNIEWYGNDNTNNILVTGKYKVQVLLTCRPQPYIMDMELDWKNPYD